MQTLATILFFIVFIQLFIALSLYLGVTLYTYFKKSRAEAHDKQTKAHNTVPLKEESE